MVKTAAVSEAMVQNEPAAPATATMTLEWRRLSQAYADLRVCDARADARLAASLAELAQRSAVLVVSRDGDWVLIDGYRRVRLLKKLGLDAVDCLVLALGEVEALANCHRLETGRRRSALEDGWLVRDLDVAAGALWRAREDLQRAVVADPTTPSNARVRRAQRLTSAAYEALRGKWEEHDAGSGHPNSHLPIAR